MIRWAPAVALLALAVAPARADLGYCTKPDRPWCLDRYGAFRDNHEYRMCKMEVEAYLDQIRSWVSCSTAAAKREMDEAVDQFNLRARSR